ncbi:uncharacterized protein ACB058_006780 [Synchiropus picturatus]
MSNVSTIQLPNCVVGSRNFRYIYLVNSTSFALNECLQKDAVTPLYLGADLFSNTKIRTENHPRYHARFAKKGLATRLHFSSEFRFHGLKVSTCSNALWFYSIEGLFRVAFEIYNKLEQLSVLENLQDVWKSKINESPLKSNYTLRMLVHTALNSTANPSIESVSPRDSLRGQEAATSSDTARSPADHNYCNFVPPCLQTVRHQLQSLDEKISCKTEILTQKQLETVLLLMEQVDLYIFGKLEEKNVTETVMNLLNTKDWSLTFASPLLNSVARWLGCQFHLANCSISQKVEEFKLQHIERISELPPAEELTIELFPEAMRTLLLHWMGLSEESSMEKRHSEYPILLLILEFANHSLITGVAHVLYSTLICK